MGNKQAKEVSTELTDKGSFLKIHLSQNKYLLILFSEIALLKANTKFSEKGRRFYSHLLLV